MPLPTVNALLEAVTASIPVSRNHTMAHPEDKKTPANSPTDALPRFTSPMSTVFRRALTREINNAIRCLDTVRIVVANWEKNAFESGRSLAVRLAVAEDCQGQANLVCQSIERSFRVIEDNLHAWIRRTNAIEDGVLRAKENQYRDTFFASLLTTYCDGREIVDEEDEESRLGLLRIDCVDAVSQLYAILEARMDCTPLYGPQSVQDDPRAAVCPPGEGADGSIPSSAEKKETSEEPVTFPRLDCPNRVVLMSQTAEERKSEEGKQFSPACPPSPLHHSHSRDGQQEKEPESVMAFELAQRGKKKDEEMRNEEKGPEELKERSVADETRDECQDKGTGLQLPPSFPLETADQQSTVSTTNLPSTDERNRKEKKNEQREMEAWKLRLPKSLFPDHDAYKKVIEHLTSTGSFVPSCTIGSENATSFKNEKPVPQALEEQWNLDLLAGADSNQSVPTVVFLYPHSPLLLPCDSQSLPLPTIIEEITKGKRMESPEMSVQIEDQTMEEIHTRITREDQSDPVMIQTEPDHNKSTDHYPSLTLLSTGGDVIRHYIPTDGEEKETRDQMKAISSDWNRSIVDTLPLVNDTEGEVPKGHYTSPLLSPLLTTATVGRDVNFPTEVISGQDRSSGFLFDLPSSYPPSEINANSSEEDEREIIQSRRTRIFDPLTISVDIEDEQSSVSNRSLVREDTRSRDEHEENESQLTDSVLIDARMEYSKEEGDSEKVRRKTGTSQNPTDSSPSPDVNSRGITETLPRMMTSENSVEEPSQFRHTRIDVVGPFSCYNDDGQKDEVSMLLFTCLSSGEVNLQLLMQTGSPSDFMYSIDAFCEANENVKFLWSDSESLLPGHHSSYSGGEDDLLRARRELDVHLRLRWHLQSWNHSNSDAEKHGRKHARRVKECMYATIGRIALPINDLTKYMAHVEVMIGCRPRPYNHLTTSTRSLHPISKDESTPARRNEEKNTSRGIMHISERFRTSEEETLTSLRLRIGTELRFWKLWNLEFLSRLRDTLKEWQRSGEYKNDHIAAGMLVFFEEGSHDRGEWIIGRITRVVSRIGACANHVSVLSEYGSITERLIPQLIILDLHRTEENFFDFIDEEDSGSSDSLTSSVCSDKSHPSRTTNDDRVPNQNEPPLTKSSSRVMRPMNPATLIVSSLITAAFVTDSGLMRCQAVTDGVHSVLDQSQEKTTDTPRLMKSTASSIFDTIQTMLTRSTKAIIEGLLHSWNGSQASFNWLGNSSPCCLRRPPRALLTQCDKEHQRGGKGEPALLFVLLCLPPSSIPFNPHHLDRSRRSTKGQKTIHPCSEMEMDDFSATIRTLMTRSSTAIMESLLYSWNDPSLILLTWLMSKSPRVPRRPPRALPARSEEDREGNSSLFHLPHPLRNSASPKECEEGATTTSISQEAPANNESRAIWGGRFLFHLNLMFLPVQGVCTIFSKESSPIPPDPTPANEQRSTNDLEEECPPKVNPHDVDYEEMARVDDEIIRELERQERRREEQAREKIRERERLLCVRSPSPVIIPRISTDSFNSDQTLPEAVRKEVQPQSVTNWKNCSVKQTRADWKTAEKGSKAQTRQEGYSTASTKPFERRTIVNRKVIAPFKFDGWADSPSASNNRKGEQKNDGPLQAKNIRCEYCDNPNHSAELCRSVVGPEKRRAFLRKHNRCLGCLRKGCKGNCDVRCKGCRAMGHHHSNCLRNIQ